MAYQLENPTLDVIVSYCQDMRASEETEVYDFGGNSDLVLHIHKDEDYDAETGEYNLVRVYTYQNGECVDNTEDVFVGDDAGELLSELERIQKYKDFGTT